MTTATASPVKGLRTIRYIPAPGEHQLSINLGLVNLATVIEFAHHLGVTPELVQIPGRDGVEVHALLICEQLPESPMAEESELSMKVDQLAEQIGSFAPIRHVYGRRNARV
jgi:hypothetical protein